MNVPGLKALRRMVFRRYPYRIFSLPRSTFDYQSAVGDGTGSSTVMAPLNWIARTFPEAPPLLWRQLETGQEEPVRNHPMLRLLQKPNGWFFGPQLWMATLIDWNVDGNAYWIKVRNGTGAVQELWWAPHWLMEAKGDDKELVTHYEYRADGGAAEPLKLKPDDVVHFRFGLDPDNPRLGASPLKSVLREVFTDNEAATFTAALLRNSGVPGVVISPDGDTSISKEDADETKAYLEAMFGGDNRGKPMVMSSSTKVQQFGFSPEQLSLTMLRRVPEERVTAVLGVPAIVAGLGAGLERSTFTNMGEAREMAYESNIIPSQRIIAEDIRFQLLSDFEKEDALWTMRFGFDLSKVRVLQEDEDKRALRFGQLVRDGIAMVGEGRRAAGLPVDESHNVFLRDMNKVQVPADGSEPVSFAPAGGNGNGNGNGGGLTEESVMAAVRRVLAET